jgi:MFS family permease
MPPPDPAAASDRYARYVLGVLVVVYVFNFLDRQILSILAERIRADLGVGDAELGFLYGTAFAVFYALFGIPLGRLADVWDRRLLIAIGLAVWSGMTMLSGLARNFPERRWRASASASVRRAPRRPRSPSCRTTSPRRGARPRSRSTRAGSTSAPGSGWSSAAG